MASYLSFFSVYWEATGSATAIIYSIQHAGSKLMQPIESWTIFNTHGLTWLLVRSCLAWSAVQCRRTVEPTATSLLGVCDDVAGCGRNESRSLGLAIQLGWQAYRRHERVVSFGTPTEYHVRNRTETRGGDKGRSLERPSRGPEAVPWQFPSG